MTSAKRNYVVVAITIYIVPYRNSGIQNIVRYYTATTQIIKLNLAFHCSNRLMVQSTLKTSSRVQ